MEQAISGGAAEDLLWPFYKVPAVGRVSSDLQGDVVGMGRKEVEEEVVRQEYLGSTLGQGGRYLCVANAFLPTAAGQRGGLQ